MSVTPEREAELRAEVRAFFRQRKLEKALPPIPKPKVVTDNGMVIRDADVVVSPLDPNARHRQDRTKQNRTGQLPDGEVVTVRRNEPQRIRNPHALGAYDGLDMLVVGGEADEARGRQQRREADPFNLGHWGSHDD
jgi:hypothetical protein